MGYKTKTRYGECPQCGELCQPDFIGMPHPNNDVDEYAVCCDCRIIWEYHHPRDFARKYEGWEEVWQPVNIETFERFGDIPYECKDKS